MNSPTLSRHDLPRALSRDQGRLRRLLGRASAPDAGADALAAFRAALAESIAAREARAAARPVPRFDAQLPVSREAERIIELIRAHQVLVVAGETGSGKTTQLPKLCLAAGRGEAGWIGCTQPRRLAARAVARRVAQELQSEPGQAVGFQVRFTEAVSERSYIKFMTDGILLAEIQSDRFLSAYDTLIIDEAHERSLNIDFLLGYLKGLLPRRPDLKLIVTSATIDTERFARHFENAPVLSIEGRSHPVELRYRPPQAGGEDPDETTGRARGRPRAADADPIAAVVDAIDEITAEDRLGDVLVFLPGEREIRDLHQAIDRRRYRETEVLPLYARLSARDQDRVFNPGPRRRIVLATNVAETSLTVPRIRYVVDPGAARVKRYSPRARIDRLRIEPISQASADQRAGRCGRVAAGVCFRLYAESDYQARPRFTDPEILRSSLANVILRMLALGLGRVEDFPFIDAPDPRSIADGWQQLLELGAVDRERRLTPTGRSMARLPIDAQLARMLVAAHTHAALSEISVIAAFLGIQDPRERPSDQRQAADAAHAEFADPRSEFVGLLKLWDAYRRAHEDLTQSKLREWCARRFLGYLRMREWRELHRQLIVMCGELGWTPNVAAADYGVVHRCLIAGLPGQIGHRLEKGQYEGPRGRRFALFPGSTLARQPPPWVISAILLDTQTVWGLVNARIEPEWAIAELSGLLTRRYHDPHWSRAQGRVLGSEQISLFGLVLAPRRGVHYGALHPEESRELFVRQGLVPGEVNTRLPFLARNLATLAEAREEEAKQRRAGLVEDEDWQARWYLDRLPAGLCSTVDLERWWRDLPSSQRRALEWSVADLLPGEGSASERFPAWLALGEARLALHYRFEPGAEDDGVTLDVPLHLLNALDPARLEWLVPGLVEEKAAALIRALPKPLRRNFVPAPDFARAFAQAHPEPSADRLRGALARFLARATGAPVAGTDFDESALEPHLRLNLRLLDPKGEVLAQSRSLEQLREAFGGHAEQAFAARAGHTLASEGLRQFPLEEIPEQIPGEAGLPAFPALVDDGEVAALRVFADPQQARLAHPGGVARLLRIALADRVRQAIRQLPVSARTGLLHAAIEHQDRLRADLVEAALRELVDALPAGLRRRADFEQAVARIGRGLFEAATARLRLAEQILALAADLRARLDPPLMGWASANLDDLRDQLGALLAPGFLRETPPDALQRFPCYLEAMLRRLDRLLRDPTRDQTRMLELMPFTQALAAARARGVDRDPAWQALRWEVEELRVSLFAQELGTRGSVSPKRLAQRLQQLTSS